MSENIDDREFEGVSFGSVSNCSFLNVRSAPDATASIVSILSEGTELIIEDTECINDFYKVRFYPNGEGYCMSKYVAIQ